MAKIPHEADGRIEPARFVAALSARRFRDELRETLVRLEAKA